ncbi:hypothetical protein Psi02_62440 [Planotetraspora silvatica]|uniref:Uncharacterized protein n=1 Tax=Planotetraspora silvatica TaxID=234614 RepID=A0A8J3XR44_9ACTN|nr:hypothetical protein [Planotetraspora silvatica]GII49820.1 hypothetical protein Psi02_62440 [Planotetraspora silvatica]
MVEQEAAGAVDRARVAVERDGYAHQSAARAFNTEMFIRMAETFGLPITGRRISDEWISVSIGTPPDEERPDG